MEGPLALDGAEGIRATSAPAAAAAAAAAAPNAFSRPRPRPPRSPSQLAKVRVTNRRREYLARNPQYFQSAEHEFADLDLYDSLVRHFLSPAERAAEARAKGWGKTLESSLLRGEARRGRLAASATGDGAAATSSSAARTPPQGGAPTDVRALVVVADWVDAKPACKEEGRAAWDAYLRERFVRGGDEDFDYRGVDEDEGLDSLESRDREDAYFDDEEPEWADDSDGSSDAAVGDGREADEGQRPKRERILVGQTGVQDY